jgi:hypothetical protein
MQSLLDFLKTLEGYSVSTTVISGLLIAVGGFIAVRAYDNWQKRRQATTKLEFSHEVHEGKARSGEDDRNEFGLPSDSSNLCLVTRVTNKSSFPVTVDGFGYKHYQRSLLGFMLENNAFALRDNLDEKKDQKVIEPNQVAVYKVCYYTYLREATAALFYNPRKQSKAWELFLNPTQKLDEMSADEQKKALAKNIRSCPTVKLEDGSKHQSDLVFRHPPANSKGFRQPIVRMRKWLWWWSR